MSRDHPRTATCPPTLAARQRHAAAALANWLWCCSLWSMFASSALAENWPGWRGPQRNGLSSEQHLPLQWSSSQGIAWKTALPGAGISSPIVWDDLVVVTASDGYRQQELHVIALDLHDGSERWHVRLWGTAPTLHHAYKSSMASPSPVTDGEAVYAFFGSGDLAAIDLQGRLLWHRALAEEYGAFENRFAASSSPLVFEDLVIVQCDHYGQSYLLGVQKTTGANRWKADRPECWLSWSSPTLVPVPGAGGWELLVCGSEKVEGYDPASGEKLWTFTGLARECVPTPVFGHGLAYVVSGPRGATFAIRPGGRGDVTATHLVWSSERGTPFVPSAILVGEQYYMIDDKGIGTCFDAHTGEQLWRRRLLGPVTASPVAGDGKLYLTDEEGTTAVIACGESACRELARNRLDEPVFASPAISQGRLFMRAAGHLYCITGQPLQEQ